jgi:NifU-like protein involved in Fe-S cluster formation
MYNKRVEGFFFELKHAGFAAEPADTLIYYAPVNSSNAIRFALYLKGQSLEDIRFKARGNPYVFAAAEWICRAMIAGQRNELEAFDAQHWQNCFDIPLHDGRTALQIAEACKMLLKATQTLAS